MLNPDSSVCSRPTDLWHRILWEDLGQERELRLYLLIPNAQQRKVSHIQGKPALRFCLESTIVLGIVVWDILT